MMDFIYVQNYHEIDLTELNKGPGKTATLEKPYKITKLLGAVQNLLETDI
jgi:hypothetical protein